MLYIQLGYRVIKINFDIIYIQELCDTDLMILFIKIILVSNYEYF